MTRPLSVFHMIRSLVIVLVFAGPVMAQSPADDDAALDLAEPDFTVVNIPTTLRLPVGKADFHLTHRFGKNLRDGSFGDQASVLFGLDSGAIVGLELRYAVMRHLQAIVLRSSSDRTIQLAAKYDALHQSDSMPMSVSAIASVESPNNFRKRRSNAYPVATCPSPPEPAPTFCDSRQIAPALGGVISREILGRGAVYATPIWIHNSAAASLPDTRDTFYVGLGGRARIASTVYIVGEASPRLAGYVSGQVEYGFGIEKRAGAHVFQLTFANTTGTTLAQLARGGSTDTLYLGFNLTRKFF